MRYVNLYKPFVSREDIHKIVFQFRQFNKTDIPHIRVTAKVKMEDIDIQLIAYFLLFKEERKDAVIELELKHNHSKANEKINHKLAQYASYANLMHGSVVFTTFFSNDAETFNPEYFREGGTHFEISNSFMMLCLVSKERQELFDFIFTKGLDETVGFDLYKGLPGVAWQPDSDDLRKSYYEQLIGKVPTKEPLNVLANLALFSFYKSVNDAKFLHLFTDSRYLDDNKHRDKALHVEKLKYNKTNNTFPQYQFFEAARNIFLELSTKPAIYHFVFSKLTTQLLKEELDENSSDDYLNKLSGLWRFTNDLVHGLIELAKNIKEHSSEFMGVITASIGKVTDINNMLPGQQRLFPDYLKDLKSRKDAAVDSLLQIHIVDLGKVGIIPTLLYKTEAVLGMEEEDGVMIELLEEDVENLKSGAVQLKELISTEEGSMLNQQSKRSIAHLGLMTFSNLITSNYGMVIAFSTGIKGRPDPVVLPLSASGGIDHIQVGTNFTTVLPVFSDFSAHHLDSTLPHKLLIPDEGSVNELRGLEALYRYHIIDPVKHDGLENYTEPFLILIKPTERLIRDRVHERELWKEVSGTLEKLFKNVEMKARSVVNVDLNNVKINGSILLRFLGLWEHKYSKINLLLSNVQTEVFIELDEINRNFLARNKTLDFWNANSATFVYHYIETAAPSSYDQNRYRFYFTDGLWGRKENDFDWLNWKLHRNFYNGVTSLREQAYVPIEGDDRKRLPDCNKHVLYGTSTLLPFELLLPGEGSYTLYQHNATVLLKNRIYQTEYAI